MNGQLRSLSDVDPLVESYHGKRKNMTKQLLLIVADRAEPEMMECGRRHYERPGLDVTVIKAKAVVNVQAYGPFVHFPDWNSLRQWLINNTTLPQEFKASLPRRI